MTSAFKAKFDRDYQTHLKHLKLKGLSSSTIDAYARAVRSIGEYFDYQIHTLTEEQLLDYFYDLLETNSWSSVKNNWIGYKFFCKHVLHEPWRAEVNLIKPPRHQRLPDIVTVEEARRIFIMTRVLSYRVFFFTLYSLGLRIGEGLRLEVGDIDAQRLRIHIRNSKGNKDRLVPLPTATLAVLRRFWQVHRNPVLLFPSRRGGPEQARLAKKPLDCSGIHAALFQVVIDCGIKKTSPHTLCATATPHT